MSKTSKDSARVAAFRNYIDEAKRLLVLARSIHPYGPKGVELEVEIDKFLKKDVIDFAPPSQLKRGDLVLQLGEDRQPVSAVKYEVEFAEPDGGQVWIKMAHTNGMKPTPHNRRTLKLIGEPDLFEAGEGHE
jgi:hypothetical protein